MGFLLRQHFEFDTVLALELGWSGSTELLGGGGGQPIAVQLRAVCLRRGEGTLVRKLLAAMHIPLRCRLLCCRHRGVIATGERRIAVIPPL